MTEFDIEDENGEPWRIVVRQDIERGADWIIATDENTVCHEENVWWSRRIFALKGGDLVGYGMWF